MSSKKLQKNNFIKKKKKKLQKLQSQILQSKQAHNLVKLMINNFADFDMIIVFLILKSMLIKFSV